MVDKVPLFYTENTEEQRGKQQITPKHSEIVEKTIEDKYRKDVYRHWIKLFAILTTVVSLYLILADIFGANELLPLLQTGEVLTFVWFLTITILTGLSITGIFVMLYCIFSFFARLFYSSKVWSTPMSYFDSAPTDTVTKMNAHLAPNSRHTKYYDLLIGFIGGGIAFSIPTILSIIYIALTISP